MAGDGHMFEQLVKPKQWKHPQETPNETPNNKTPKKHHRMLDEVYA